MKKPLHLCAPAFTLLELLAIIAIIGMISALTVPVVSAMRESSRTTRELGAARQLTIAYASCTAENNGRLLPGYGDFPARDEHGAALHHPINKRYPWRLAPYFGFDFRTIYVNENGAQLREAESKSRSEFIYTVSVMPNFGINAAFVGGDYQTLPPDNAHVEKTYGRVCVQRLSEAHRPTQLIAFASARAQFAGKELGGYYQVTPPSLQSRQWATKWDQTNPPESSGFVDFRHKRRAIAAMLDGHVELLTFSQMEDMRRWSNQAAAQDKADWTLTKQN